MAFTHDSTLNCTLVAKSLMQTYDKLTTTKVQIDTSLHSKGKGRDHDRIIIITIIV